MTRLHALLSALREATWHEGPLPDRGTMPMPFPILDFHIPMEKDDPAYANAPIERIPISTLLATQRTLDATNLSKFFDDPTLGGPPIVVATDQGYAIIDGHHRLAAARLSGQQDVVVRVAEDAPAMAAGHGAVAGLGVGPQGEPGVDLRKKHAHDPVLTPTLQREGKTAVRRIAIAPDSNIAFWRIGEDVYRAPMNAGLDTAGMPMGKRWECSFAHWQHYRGVFNWARDVNEAANDTFAGADVFDVGMDAVHKARAPKLPWERFSKYVGVDETGENIRAHARKNWQRNVILRDTNTGVMTYLRKRK